MEVICLKSKFLRGIFDQNTYVLLDENDAIIIDAGAEIEDVKAVIGRRKVQGILLTHIHFDHVWNLEKYLDEFDAKAYIPDGQEFKFMDKEYNASTMIHHEFKFDVPKEKIGYYSEKMKLGKFEIQVISTPGHSADSVCVKIDGNLFTGDTLFDGNIGRTDFVDASENEMIKSLKKIKNVEFDFAYPGHYGSMDKQKADMTIDMFLK